MEAIRAVDGLTWIANVASDADVPTTHFFELTTRNKTTDIDLRNVCNMSFRQETVTTIWFLLKVTIKIKSRIEIMMDNGSIIKGCYGLTKDQYNNVRTLWMNVRGDVAVKFTSLPTPLTLQP